MRAPFSSGTRLEFGRIVASDKGTDYLSEYGITWMSSSALDAPADGDRRGRRPAREHARREGPAGGGRPRLEWPGHLGSGRIVASATEAPILLANLE
jgi:hypothetical protein